jgi:hypothetical protein
MYTRVYSRIAFGSPVGEKTIRPETCHFRPETICRARADVSWGLEESAAKRLREQMRTACVPDRSQEGRLRGKVRPPDPLSRPYHPLPDFLVRQDHGRRNLRPDFAHPCVLRPCKANRQNQVAPQAARRLRVQSESAGDRSRVAFRVVWQRRGKQTNVTLFIQSMPYGGVGSSGIGNYYGKYGYDSLTHAKSILISPPDVAIDHLFPPYTKEKVQAVNQWFDY